MPDPTPAPLPEPRPGWRVLVGRKTRTHYEIRVGYPARPAATEDPTAPEAA